MLRIDCRSEGEKQGGLLDIYWSIPGRGDGGSALGSSSGDSGKRSDLRHILKVEPTGFVYVMDMRCV